MVKKSVHDRKSEPNTNDHYAVVDDAYSAQVLGRIAEKYEFDIHDTNFAWWIKKGAKRYVMFSGMRVTSKDRIDKKRRLKRIEKSINNLTDDINFEGDLFIFDHSTEIEEEIAKKGVEISLADEEISLGHSLPIVLDYLAILKGRVSEERERIDDEKNVGGRPSNEGLAEFAKYIADFWERELGEKIYPRLRSGCWHNRSI